MPFFVFNDIIYEIYVLRGAPSLPLGEGAEQREAEEGPLIYQIIDKQTIIRFEQSRISTKVGATKYQYCYNTYLRQPSIDFCISKADTKTTFPPGES